MVQVERLEQQASALSASLAAAGSESALTLPDELRSKFDEALAAEPKPLSRSELIQRRLKGVA